MHTKMSSIEKFSYFPIDCDQGAELSLLATYLRINPLVNLDVIKSFYKCAPERGEPVDWWQRYEPDYFPEISAIYSIVGEEKFNVS